VTSLAPTVSLLISALLPWLSHAGSEQQHTTDPRPPSPTGGRPPPFAHHAPPPPPSRVSTPSVVASDPAEDSDLASESSAELSDPDDEDEEASPPVSPPRVPSPQPRGKPGKTSSVPPPSIIGRIDWLHLDDQDVIDLSSNTLFAKDFQIGPDFIVIPMGAYVSVSADRPDTLLFFQPERTCLLSLSFPVSIRSLMPRPDRTSPQPLWLAGKTLSLPRPLPSQVGYNE